MKKRLYSIVAILMVMGILLCNGITDISADKVVAAETEPDTVVSLIKYGSPNELYDRTAKLEFGTEPKNENGVYMITPYAIGTFLEDNEEGTGASPSDNGIYYGFTDFWAPCGLWCGLNMSNSAVASSTLAQQGNITYDADHVIESSLNDRNSVWCEGAEGYGIGESITIKQTLYSPYMTVYGPTSDGEYGYRMQLPEDFKPEDRIKFPYTKLCIVNGYAKNEKLWAANSRVKEMKLYVNDVLYAYIHLKDTIKPQYLPLYNIPAFSTTEMSFKFEITDVYPGEKYEDTCITGIVFGFSNIGGHSADIWDGN